MRGDGDGWVRCAAGHRHWGRHGAAGLLLRDRTGGRDRVVLQHRAWWSHQGNTWGVPGGARDSHETAVAAALRETGEEAGIDPAAVRPTGLLVDDHGGWSYGTVLGEPAAAVDPRPTGGESEDVRWVDAETVSTLPLHPGFAVAWPRLRAAPAPLVLVVDAANVVGARGGGDGWWRDRAGATRRLLAALAPLAGLAPDALPPGVDGRPPRPGDAPQVIVVEGAARAVLDGGGGCRTGSRWSPPRAPGTTRWSSWPRKPRSGRLRSGDHRRPRPAGPPRPGRRPRGRAVLADPAGGRRHEPDPAVAIRVW